MWREICAQDRASHVLGHWHWDPHSPQAHFYLQWNSTAYILNSNVLKPKHLAPS